MYGPRNSHVTKYNSYKLYFVFPHTRANQLRRSVRVPNLTATYVFKSDNTRVECGECSVLIKLNDIIDRDGST